MDNQELEVTYFTDVKSKRIDWLWYPYIPFGKITILQGDPGEGKTSFVLDLSCLYRIQFQEKRKSCFPRKAA